MKENVTTVVIEGADAKQIANQVDRICSGWRRTIKHTTEGDKITFTITGKDETVQEAAERGFNDAFKEKP